MGEFFHWYASVMPRLIVRAGRGYLTRTYYWFAPPLLLRTLFAPWRRDSQDSDGLPLKARLRLWVDNGMSRLFGAVIRLTTAMIGGILLAIIGLATSVFLILWWALPLISILSLGLSVRYLFWGGA